MQTLSTINRLDFVAAFLFVGLIMQGVVLFLKMRHFRTLAESNKEMVDALQKKLGAAILQYQLSKVANGIESGDPKLAALRARMRWAEDIEAIKFQEQHFSGDKTMEKAQEMIGNIRADIVGMWADLGTTAAKVEQILEKQETRKGKAKLATAQDSHAEVVGLPVFNPRNGIQVLNGIDRSDD